MRSEGAIKHKLKQLRFRYLKKLLDANFKRNPGNCKHNHRHTQGKGEIGLCLYGSDEPESWKGIVCDEEVGGIRQARSCDYFTPHKTKLELKSEFDTLVRGDIAKVASRYPDMAALLWALGDEASEGVLAPSWLERFWLSLHRPRVEELAAPEEFGDVDFDDGDDLGPGGGGITQGVHPHPDTGRAD